MEKVLFGYNIDMVELNGYRDLTEFEVFKKCKVI